jgi:acetyl-CoA hydrolase
LEDDATLDLSRFLRPGDTIAWGQGPGEPRSLSELLVDQRHRLGGVGVFLGAGFSETLRPEHGDALRFRALGGFGTNARLAKAGVLDVIPSHVSDLPGHFASGRIAVDAVFLMLSPADRDGFHHLGLAADYLAPAIERARVLLAEVNPHVPRVVGAPRIAAARLDAVVGNEGLPIEVPPPSPGPAEQQLAALAAERIPAGAALQFGIGGAPEAVCRALADHRDLGLHSAFVSDSMLDLIESGAVTNARKSIDTGITVTGLLFGTRRLFAYADDNPAIEMRPVGYTHATATLARLDRFFAVNSAVEVDLTGQVNAEAVGDAHIGAVGGAVDFARGARASEGGRSLIVLPSTTRDRRRSRIVPRISTVVSAARSDADMVITEHGVAELPGCGLAERARRLITIADPAFRDELTAAAGSLV